MTRAECASRFTVASSTPGAARSERSTCAWHAAQVMPWMGRTTVSTAFSEVVLRASSAAAGCGASGVNALFDKKRLEAGLTDGGEMSLRRLRIRVDSCSADPHLVDLRARHLVQRACHALHTCSAMHAIDLKDA